MWFEYDSELDDCGPRGRVNWSGIFGMVLVVGAGAGFWTGIGLLVSHFFK
jgi:hypothetical protein